MLKIENTKKAVKNRSFRFSVDYPKMGYIIISCLALDAAILCVKFQSPGPYYKKLVVIFLTSLGINEAVRNYSISQKREHSIERTVGLINTLFSIVCLACALALMAYQYTIITAPYLLHHIESVMKMTVWTAAAWSEMAVFSNTLYILIKAFVPVSMASAYREYTIEQQGVNSISRSIMLLWTNISMAAVLVLLTLNHEFNFVKGLRIHAELFIIVGLIICVITIKEYRAVTIGQ